MLIAWSRIFPAIDNPDHYYGYVPSKIQLYLFALAAMTPAAVIGGFIGGRISLEGGDRGQRVIAFIIAAFFSLPFSCYVFWQFTGF